MSNWMQKLDRKMGTMLDQMDEAGQPMTQVMNFDVFHRVDEDEAKAERLLRIRQDDAGLDYEPPADPVKVAPEMIKRTNGKTCTCEMVAASCSC